MTKIKTRDLEGASLDWAVAKCEKNAEQAYYADWHPFSPSTKWLQGGTIIEREGLTIIRCDDDFGIDEKGFCNNIRIPVWAATTGQHPEFWLDTDDPLFEILKSDVVFGPTPLVAAMRCFVLSKIGEEVDLPDKLIKGKP